MKSVFDKQQLWNEHCTSPQSPGQATEVKYLIALIEIREAIEEGFAKIEKASVDGICMMTGVKETFDGFLETRLESNKVLRGLATDVMARVDKIQEIQEQPDEPVDKPEKSTETLDVGGIAQPASGSGIS